MRKQVTGSKYNFHRRCTKTNLTHLCFADDVLIFFKGTKESVDSFLQALNTFVDISGLKVNPAKSLIFTYAVDHHKRCQLLTSTGFSSGTLSVRCLGIPLVSSRLTKDDCNALVSKITARISYWSAHYLSYTGHLQLVNSILFGIQTYWSSMFILPTRIYKQIEQLMSCFL